MKNFVLTLVLVSIVFFSGTAKPQEKKDGAGTQWELSPTTPRFGSVLFRFEDPEKKLWPTYITGRGAGKTLLTMVPTQKSFLVPQGKIHVKGDNVADIFSLNHPRTLEPLLGKEESLPVELKISYIDQDPKLITEHYLRRGKKGERVHLRYTAKGELTVGNKRIPVRGLLRYRLRLTNRKPYLGIGFQTQINGQDIGLKQGKIKLDVEALAAKPGSGIRKRK